MAVQALLGAVGGAAAGGLMGMGTSAFDRSQDFKYQKKIMKHAIRWRVQDMKAAGINPLLAVTGGLSPGSTSFSSHSSKGQNIDLPGAERTAAETKKTGVAQRLLQAETAFKQAQTVATRQQAATGAAQEALARAHEADVTTAQQLKALQIPAAEAEAALYIQAGEVLKGMEKGGVALPLLRLLLGNRKAGASRAMQRRSNNNNTRTKDPHIVPKRNR